MSSLFEEDKKERWSLLSGLMFFLQDLFAKKAKNNSGVFKGRIEKIRLPRSMPERFYTARFITMSGGIASIGFINDVFMKVFYPKSFTKDSAAELWSRSLKEGATDATIYKPIENTLPITPYHLSYILSLQPEGEAGILLTSGRQNIFYLYDQEVKNEKEINAKKPNLYRVTLSWGDLTPLWNIVATPFSAIGGMSKGNEKIFYRAS